MRSERRFGSYSDSRFCFRPCSPPSSMPDTFPWVRYFPTAHRFNTPTRRRNVLSATRYYNASFAPLYYHCSYEYKVVLYCPRDCIAFDNDSYFELHLLPAWLVGPYPHELILLAQLDFSLRLPGMTYPNLTLDCDSNDGNDCSWLVFTGHLNFIAWTYFLS